MREIERGRMAWEDPLVSLGLELIFSVELELGVLGIK